MGIPHFEEQDADVVLDVLQLRWTATEKLDGSYFEFGLDNEGKYFSKRKGGHRCYTVNDWESEGWTNAYRAGHIAAEEICDFLVERGVIWPGTMIYSEIMFGDRPNTIPYANTATIAIQGWSYSTDLSIPAFHLKNFSTTVMHEMYHSYDARTKVRKQMMTTWNVICLSAISGAYIFARLETPAKALTQTINDFRNALHQDLKMTTADLMKLKLNKRPGWIMKEDWPEVKRRIIECREKWQRLIVPELRAFRERTLRALLHDQYSELRGSQFGEGLVIKTWNRNTVKFTDREGFTKANEHAHWVKYAIVGGRRPRRPSFLSRTKDWPVEERLARLDKLAERYLRHRHKLSKQFPNGTKLMPVSYDLELHERTKLMFCDTRERIANGR